MTAARGVEFQDRSSAEVTDRRALGFNGEHVMTGGTAACEEVRIWHIT